MIHKNLYRLFPKIASFAFVLTFIAFLITCKKPEREAKVETKSISDITTTTAKATGDIIDLGDGIIDYGHCWRLLSTPTIADSKTSLGSITKTGSFTSDLQNLEPGKTYHVRAYVKSGNNRIYGADVSFTTTQIVVPVLTTSPVTSFTLTTAVSGGNITADGGGAIIAKGTCWSTITNPTISDSKTSDGTGTGSFTSNLTGLVAGTTYHIRSYATNNAGTAYGNDVTFTTTAIALSTLTTTAATSITLTTAVSGGNITADGGGSVAARGICWATTTSPTLTDTKTTDGTGTGSFTSNFSGLLPGTTYYVRAYATNSAGSAYGNEVSFTTSQIVLVTLTTTGATSITLTTAVSGGNITANGGGNITARGVCWATTATPTISNFITTDGTGSGIFTSNLSALLPGTTYHVRAYAINSAGSAYGNEITFTTNPIVVPTLTTTAATSIGLTTAVSGGNITADGGGTITARGVCWSTTTNPTISDSKTYDGSGTGNYISNLNGLSDGTTYYLRAYATNIAGTSYGNEIRFNTKISDVEGNMYNTVTIGTQVWMKENLKTTRYNDGSSIPNVTDDASWAGLSSPAYCWYNNDAATYKDTYGALYNWYTFDASSNGNKNVCPTGWHVPRNDDWWILINLFGGEGNSGGSLRESGTVHWMAPNSYATNESGFTALPGGYRSGSSGFLIITYEGWWWSSSMINSNIPYYWYTHTGSKSMSWEGCGKNNGLSIRCIKD